MEYTRLLKRGLTGNDVRCVKDKLLELGYLHASTHNTFGADTCAAVKRYQTDRGLDADGIIGPLTWAALFDGVTPDETVNPTAFPYDGDLPGQISETVAQAIMADLGGVNEPRRAIVLDALQYAFDPSVPADYPFSLYVRGGNLYNTDLGPNVITLARIAAGAASQPQYYDGGRREMMEAAVRGNPRITGADCSGGIVGLMRHAGMVSPGFDANADTLASRCAAAIEKAALRPADWVHKSGHIGLYAGGGRVVEWMGGAYGCQLSGLDDRRGYSFVTRRRTRMGAWTGFLRPTYY